MSLIFINKVLESNPKVNLTQNKFNLAFGLTFQNSTVATNLKYFDFSFEIIQWIGIDTYIKKTIPLVNCEYENFQGVNEALFYLNGLSKMVCPNISLIENFTISGLYTDDWYQFLELKIKLKQEHFSQIKDVEKFLIENPLLFQLFFIDSGMDYDNLNHPLTRFLNYYYTSFSFSFMKYSQIYISELNFSNDENLFYNNPSQVSVSILEKVFEYNYAVTDRSKTSNSPYNFDFMIITITASPKYYILNRVYQKLPDLFANLSGLLSQILFILVFFISITNKNSAHNKMMSKVLKYKGKKDFDINYLSENFSFRKMQERTNKMVVENNKASCKDQNKSSPLINYSVEVNSKILFQNKELSLLKKKKFNFKKKNKEKLTHTDYNYKKIEMEESKISHKEEKSNEIKLKEIESDKLKFINISTLDMLFIKAKCCCKRFRSRKIILRAGKEKIFFYLDVITYLKKMQELDTLKYLLLSSDQRNLFSFLSKPLIAINDASSSVYKEYQSDQKNSNTLTKEEINQMTHCYQNILNHKKLTSINKKLIDIVDAEISEIENMKL